MLTKYYDYKDYGVVFLLSDKEAKKFIGVVKTTKTDNSIEKRLDRILLSKKPADIYNRILENKSSSECIDIDNMNDNEKLIELKKDIHILDLIQARHIFLDEIKKFLTKKFTRYFFDVVLSRYNISKDGSSNSKEIKEDLFPNTISEIPKKYKTSISNKKDLRKITVKALKDIGEGTMKDIITQMKKEWNINRNLKLDYRVLTQYIREHSDKKRGKGSGNTIYIASEKKFESTNINYSTKTI